LKNFSKTILNCITAARRRFCESFENGLSH
jgi:hypothetical protein